MVTRVLAHTEDVKQRGGNYDDSGNRSTQRSRPQTMIIVETSNETRIWPQAFSLSPYVTNEGNISFPAQPHLGLHRSISQGCGPLKTLDLKKGIYWGWHRLQSIDLKGPQVFFLLLHLSKTAAFPRLHIQGTWPLALWISPNHFNFSFLASNRFPPQMPGFGNLRSAYHSRSSSCSCWYPF